MPFYRFSTYIWVTRGKAALAAACFRPTHLAEGKHAVDVVGGSQPISAPDYLIVRLLRTFAFAVGALYLLPLAVFSALHADMPKAPPPPTLEESVQGSTVIVVATGIELRHLVRNSQTGQTLVEKLPDDPGQYSGRFNLRAKVGELLYCQKPCSANPEIFIQLALNGTQIPNVKRLFLDQTYIFMLVDRPLGTHGIPKEFAEKWYARNLSSVGFFVRLDSRPQVMKAIQDTFHAR
jgi:hypothetical protein